MAADTDQNVVLIVVFTPYRARSGASGEKGNRLFFWVGGASSMREVVYGYSSCVWVLYNRVFFVSEPVV